MSDVFRLGMIGLDTSHCIAFTRIFHDPDAAEELRGFRVVAGYPSFSEDLSFSAERISQYKSELSEKFGVAMTESIPALLAQVDGVLLTSVDGRRHLAELRPVLEARKPVYIDKPFAAGLADAKEMARLIKQSKVPCFSASSLRFDSAFADFQATRGPEAATRPADAPLTAPQVFGCDAYSPAALEPTNPGFFWYGIHGVEILYTIMGRGCKRVQCSSTEDGDLAVGVWEGGRIGTMRGIRKGAKRYGAAVLLEEGFECRPAQGDFYRGLCVAITEMFRTGHVPVPIDETLELCAYIEAAWQSSQHDGDEIEIDL